MDFERGSLFFFFLDFNFQDSPKFPVNIWTLTFSRDLLLGLDDDEVDLEGIGSKIKEIYALDKISIDNLQKEVLRVFEVEIELSKE